MQFVLPITYYKYKYQRGLDLLTKVAATTGWFLRFFWDFHENSQPWEQSTMIRGAMDAFSSAALAAETKESKLGLEFPPRKMTWHLCDDSFKLRRGLNQLPLIRVIAARPCLVTQREERVRMRTHNCIHPDTQVTISPVLDTYSMYRESILYFAHQ